MSSPVTVSSTTTTMILDRTPIVPSERQRPRGRRSKRLHNTQHIFCSALSACSGLSPHPRRSLHPRGVSQRPPTLLSGAGKMWATGGRFTSTDLVPSYAETELHQLAALSPGQRKSPRTLQTFAARSTGRAFSCDGVARAFVPAPRFSTPFYIPQIGRAHV